jgi:hypothetical protein
MLAEKAPKPLLEGSIREEHVDDLLGSVRLPRMPTKLV